MSRKRSEDLGRREHEKIVGSLNCVSKWNQNIRREMKKEELVVVCKNLETSCSDCTLENGLA